MSTAIAPRILLVEDDAMFRETVRDTLRGAGYLVDEIAPGEIAHSRVADIPMDNAAITVDYEADGRVHGIELLGASRALRAETTYSQWFRAGDAEPGGGQGNALGARCDHLARRD